MISSFITLREKKLKYPQLLSETASQQLFANVNCQSPHGFSAVAMMFECITVITRNRFQLVSK